MLLEFHLGDRRSYVWSVTRDSLTTVELPEQRKINDAARTVNSLLMKRLAQESPASQVAQTDVVRVERQLQQATASLSDLVLSPIAAQLGRKRLVIVSDGALHYVPFGALPSPIAGPTDAGNTSTGRSRRVPLIMDHEIVRLPSASVLAVSRGETADRPPASKTVCILANPVFSPMDTRVTQGSSPPPTDTDDSPAKTGPGLMGLTRMRWTAFEARGIVAMAPPGSTRSLLDFNATRAMVMSPELTSCRILHFATHGIVDDKNPELSGLVLSLVDRRGRPQNGFLSLEDIYHLDLHADLVVLSACKTAVGKNIKGEGLVTMARGFMYAGAPRVVASLWDVDDSTTAELMRLFYRGMLHDHKPAAAALRNAQIDLSKQRRWASPIYWAAFELHGEWR